MEALRKKQIAEVLDEDRNINREVFRREQQQVQVFKETIKPLDQANVDNIYKTERDIGAFMKELETASTDLTGFYDNTSKISSWGAPIGDLVMKYNILVQNATMPTLTGRTKKAIESKIQSISSSLEGMVYESRQVVLDGIQYIRNENHKMIRGLGELVLLYAMLKLMKHRLFINDYQLISPGDVNYSLDSILSDFPQDIDILKKSFSFLPRTGLQLQEQKKFQELIEKKESESGKPLSTDEKLILARTYFGNILPSYAYRDIGMRIPSKEEKEDINWSTNTAFSEQLTRGISETNDELLDRWITEAPRQEDLNPEQYEGSDVNPMMFQADSAPSSLPPSSEGAPGPITTTTTRGRGRGRGSGRGRGQVKKAIMEGIEGDPYLYNDEKNEMFD